MPRPTKAPTRFCWNIEDEDLTTRSGYVEDHGTLKEVGVLGQRFLKPSIERKREMPIPMAKEDLFR
ncbi:MAG: hypothetical protein ACPG8I_07405 [Candidatus Poseidoniaceae archaeon]